MLISLSLQAFSRSTSSGLPDMDNFLNRLYRNPYAPIDAASITRVDDAGNGYDDWNNMIAPATAPHQQTWGEIGQNALMSPVRIGASLLDSINPYHQNEHPITDPNASNFRVPPLATETWNAISAPGRAYYDGMSPEEMQHTAATAAGLMMGGGGLTSGLESAAARGGVNIGDRVMARYLDWKHPEEYSALSRTPLHPNEYKTLKTMPDGVFRNERELDDAYYADLNRRAMETYGVGYEGLTREQTRHIRDGIKPIPRFSVIDGGLAANADGRPGVMQALSSAYAPDNSLYIFGGKNAKTADLAKLSLAEELAAKGADRNAIWNETGWFQGPDQKWRFEIDDSRARWKEAPPMPGESKRGVLGNFLQHPELMGAYPEANAVPTQYVNVKNPSGPLPTGLYNPELNTMAIRDAGEFADPRSTGLHEAQHYVQTQEGFSPGASARAAPPDMASMGLANEWYRRNAGEVEARNVQARMNMTPDERRATPPWETQDIPYEDQIVRMGNGGPQYSMSEPKNALAAGAVKAGEEPSLLGSALAGAQGERPWWER